ncbi:Zinc finger MYM-type protein 1 [Merluccius polli]|uniref:Zinc finger MYM-type protein 1 n=1 Tax=Merluccius polli TaxID=89951 RepID=A0AA47M0N5_MERPO|nr:Zinc finger MYM-type protein 1 [Merluccius polli]
MDQSKRPKKPSGAQFRKRRKEEKRAKDKSHTGLFRDCPGAIYLLSLMFLAGLLRDISHTEQLSVVIRVVSLTEEKPCIKEHFMGFLEAEESTGLHLASLIPKRLEELKVRFEDCRGEAYDNGANMKGKNKGVQARLLQINPRALFVPCEQVEAVSQHAS